MAGATRRLVLLNLPGRRQLVDHLERLIDNHTKLALGALRNRPYASGRDVAEDVLAAAMDQAIAAHGGPAWGRRASRLWWRRSAPTSSRRREKG